MLGLLAVALASAAGAQGEVCEAPREVDRYQLLRRLSLDLRGQVPTYEEYLALDGAADVPANTIRSMIASEDFKREMRRYHESFLWPNVSNVTISDNTYQIAERNGVAWARPNTTWGRIQRNMNTQINGQLPPYQYCGDYQQTAFDPAYPGEFRPVVQPNAEGFRIEGWRMVEPYWAPGTQIKVCAYEAQQTLYPDPPDVRTTIDGKANQRRMCSDRSGANQMACGCGPNLRWCSPGGNNMDNKVKAAYREQFGRAIDDVTSGRGPYTDLLLSKKAWENGPISWYSKQFGAVTAPNVIYNAPDRLDAPTRDFSDENWIEVTRGGVHAGILTLPAYLLRFQTQRGRANRMLEAFACEPYVAPADLIPRPGCSTNSADLTNRCFCQSCHSSLEPIANAWGLFTESGSTMLTDSSRFPIENELCAGAARGSTFCRRLYVTDQQSPAKGKALAYEFALAHPDYPEIIQAGPARAAQKLIDSGTVARCTVRRLFTRLMRRDVLYEGSNAPERELLDQLAKEFEASNYDYPALVERLVTLPEYRRVR